MACIDFRFSLAKAGVLCQPLNSPRLRPTPGPNDRRRALCLSLSACLGVVTKPLPADGSTASWPFWAATCTPTDHHDCFKLAEDKSVGFDARPVIKQARGVSQQPADRQRRHHPGHGPGRLPGAGEPGGLHAETGHVQGHGCHWLRRGHPGQPRVQLRFALPVTSHGHQAQRGRHARRGQPAHLRRPGFSAGAGQCDQQKTGRRSTSPTPSSARKSVPKTQTAKPSKAP